MGWECDDGRLTVGPALGEPQDIERRSTRHKSNGVFK